jgi:hypothetical protein
MGRNSNMTKSNETAIALVLATDELPELTAARLAVVVCEGEAQGTKRDYARTLNQVFKGISEEGLPWYERAHSENSPQMKLITAEKDILFAELKKPTNRLPKGHSNPSAVWSMVRKYAEEEAAITATDERITMLIREDGLSLGDAQAKVAAEARAASEGANSKRHPSTRYSDEIMKLHRYGEAIDPTEYDTTLMDRIAKANAYLAQAYEAMGFPATGLKKG